MQFIKRFLVDLSGATAIEYALIASIISISILSAVQGIGDHLETDFQTVSQKLQ